MNNAVWFDNIRIYHLLIDRFNGGWQTPPKSENVFCGGNLQGVIDKLDYIKELGFNAIMLSPIFKTANYHGYHTTISSCSTWRTTRVCGLSATLCPTTAGIRHQSLRHHC